VPESQNLDLDDISLVPARLASHVPYMAFIARCRDLEEPAVVVLTNSDEAGDRTIANYGSADQR
jgi:nitrogen fixation protein